MIKNRLILIATIYLIIGCGKTDKVDTSNVQEAIKKREIRKISEVEIIEAGLKQGKKDSEHLINCINRSGIGVLEEPSKCNTDEKLVGEKIKLVEDKETSSLDSMEYALLEAYSFNFSQGQKLYPNIQDLNNGYLLFTAPVYKTNDSLSLAPSDSLTDFSVILIHYPKKEVVLRVQ